MSRLILALTVLLAAAFPGAALADLRFDEAPRTAVMTAMPPEMAVLEPALTHRAEYRARGVVFLTGEIEGRAVVLFQSGVSMVNTAMTTQLALERFNIVRIVFSGVAGGVDPSLEVGDVVVADDWMPYLEARFVREENGRFQTPEGLSYPNYGMILPRPESVMTPRGIEQRYVFPADRALLVVARRTAAETRLARCDPARPTVCLPRDPRILVGGHGLSASVFLDNAAFRTWLFATFHAQAVDMETASAAQVAYANGVPFIAFRSLSDLAGADPGENSFDRFVGLAALNAATTLRAFLREMEE